MEEYAKPFIEIVELLKEDAILTSCGADSGGDGPGGQSCTLVMPGDEC